MANAFTATLDRRGSDRWKRKTRGLDRIMGDAVRAGAEAGAEVMQANAPIGTSSRPSQYYRARGYGHGTLRSSIRARKIDDLAYAMAPMGPKGFARAFVEIKSHWTRRVKGQVRKAAQRASEAVLDRYARA
jgi:hypothetical protein